MTDAVLILFDRSEHPQTIADTAQALRSLKGVWHTELLGPDATVDVATVRAYVEAAVARLADLPAAKLRAEDERLRQVGAL